MNKIEAISFDISFYDKRDEFQVVSKFKGAINLKSPNEEILTITNKRGVLRGIAVELTNLSDIFEIDEKFLLYENTLIGKNLTIVLNGEKARDFYLDIKKINREFFENNIEKFLESQSSQGILQIFKEKRDLINQFLFEKIKLIDKNYTCLKGFSEEIVKLYSGGIGSTPSVDDVLVGMIIAAKVYGDDIEIFRKSYKNTTFISRNMLLNVLEDRVSDNIRELYENEDFNKLEDLTKKIGSSSGIDMLVGTYFYFKKRRGEFCLRNL